MASIEIRRATEADIEDMGNLMKELGYQTSLNMLATQLQHYNESGSIALIATHEENQVAGLASAHVIPLLHEDGCLGRITAMVVSENVRGHGVGKSLIEAIEKWFVVNRCTRFEVTSGDHRNSAHMFYERLGYIADERRFLKRP